uniref:2OGFeDO JBP1/TET oxygenase domain-containing protein n=1 Tax=viral metagenome TaxID=1070528 RepID=A0A6C0AMK9_9ZZZZ
MAISDEELFDGLQLPKEPAKDPKTKVKELVLEPKMSNDEIKAREGTYFSEKDADTIYDEDIDVYAKDPDAPEGKRLLFKLRKNVIPHDIVKLGWKSFYNAAGASRNRGAAAGPIDPKSKYWTRRKLATKTIKGWSAQYMENGKLSKMRVNNNVFSSVLGYFEKTPFMGLPCRLTSYTQRYFNEYKAGLPYIEAIDDLFKKLVPDRYKVQHKRAAGNSAFQIKDTAFSSVTINRNFRTGLHMDAGDLREGFGNLSVIERGKYGGGFTIFPRFKVGINLRTGDFVAMDVHEWHCNTEMKEDTSDKKFNSSIPEVYVNNKETGTQGIDKLYSRLSFVCYLREKLVDCKAKDSLPYYKRIGYNPRAGTLEKKKSVTRKKKE